MAVPIMGSHLQFKELPSLAEINGYFGGTLGHFCLLFQKDNASESNLRCALNANWQETGGADTEGIP